jgi:hypothetical protein
MSINAVGSTSGSKKSAFDLASEYFYEYERQPQVVAQQPSSMLSMLQQVLAQTLQQGCAGLNLGQGGSGGQRGGGGGYRDDYYGAQFEAQHAPNKADSASTHMNNEEALLSQSFLKSDSNGLLDSISDLLETIAPLLGDFDLGFDDEDKKETQNFAPNDLNMLAASFFKLPKPEEVKKQDARLQETRGQTQLDELRKVTALSEFPGLSSMSTLTTTAQAKHVAQKLTTQPI